MWRLARSLQNASRGLKHPSARSGSLWIISSEKPKLTCLGSIAARGPSLTLSVLSCVSPLENSVTSRQKTGYSYQAFSKFHTSVPVAVSNVVQFPLAQTGEGIKECELTQWYVEVKEWVLRGRSFSSPTLPASADFSPALTLTISVNAARQPC